MESSEMQYIHILCSSKWHVRKCRCISSSIIIRYSLIIRLVVPYGDQQSLILIVQHTIRALPALQRFGTSSIVHSIFFSLLTPFFPNKKRFPRYEPGTYQILTLHIMPFSTSTRFNLPYMSVIHWWTWSATECGNLDVSLSATSASGTLHCLPSFRTTVRIASQIWQCTFIEIIHSRFQISKDLFTMHLHQVALRLRPSTCLDFLAVCLGVFASNFN